MKTIFGYFIFLSILASCTTSKSQFYSFEKSNYLVFQVFALKDFECGTFHSITSWIPGEGKKTDIDTCVRIISAIPCSSWRASNPTPIQCKGLESKNK